MNRILTSSVAIILICMMLSLGLTAWVRHVLLKHAILDVPNERSSHKIPVPRGGGWALVAVLIPGLIISATVDHSVTHYAGIIAGAILLATISWLDDRHNISPLLRLGLHLAAAALGTLALPPGAMVLGGFLPLWLDRALTIIGWAWFINLYNFMDGIDGITGVETISIATGVCLLMTAAGIDAPFIDTMTLMLTGVSLGFLALNWHPAKIFLGDVGSVPLGYLGGFALLTLAAKGLFVPALILPLYYLADSGITITKRALRGEKIWQAHRQHFYQRAAAGLARHDKVVSAIIVGNMMLIGAAWVAVTSPVLGLVFGATVTAALLGFLQKAANRP